MMYNPILHDMLAYIESDSLVAFSKINSGDSLRAEFKRTHKTFAQAVFVLFELSNITITCWDRLAVLNRIRLDVADPQVFEKTKLVIERFLHIE